LRLAHWGLEPGRRGLRLARWERGLGRRGPAPARRGSRPDQSPAVPRRHLLLRRPPCCRAWPAPLWAGRRRSRTRRTRRTGPTWPSRTAGRAWRAPVAAAPPAQRPGCWQQRRSSSRRRRRSQRPPTCDRPGRSASPSPPPVIPCGRAGQQHRCLRPARAGYFLVLTVLVDLVSSAISSASSTFFFSCTVPVAGSTTSTTLASSLAVSSLPD